MKSRIRSPRSLPPGLTSRASNSPISTEKALPSEAIADLDKAVLEDDEVLTSSDSRHKETSPEVASTAITPPEAAKDPSDIRIKITHDEAVASAKSSFAADISRNREYLTPNKPLPQDDDFQIPEIVVTKRPPVTPPSALAVSAPKPQPRPDLHPEMTAKPNIHERKEAEATVEPQKITPSDIQDPSHDQRILTPARPAPRLESSPSETERLASRASPAASAIERPMSKTPEEKGLMRLAAHGGAAYWSLTVLIALMWIGGVLALGLGAENGLNILKDTPFRLSLMAMMAALPSGLIFASAFAMSHAARLSRQAARTANLADSMIAPTLSASLQAADLVSAMQSQIETTLKAVRAAQDEVLEMSQRLKSESDRISETAQSAKSAANHVSDALGQERVQLSAMTDSLNAQANHVIAAVDTQAKMVTEASDLAQAQLQEAEAALAARTADLTLAVTKVQANSLVIAETLGDQTERLETAGQSVMDQIRSVEDGLSEQRAGLVSAALSLRADQEDFAVHLENQRTQLTDALSVTRRATVDLGETSSRGIDLLRSIIDSAQDNFKALFDSADSQRDDFEARVHASLSKIADMAADARDDLVEDTQKAVDHLANAATAARQAANEAATQAKARIDHLNESLFEVDKKAQDVYENRFATARRLIEDSALMIHEAGDRTAERLDASFAAARQSVLQVDEAMGALNASAARLPAFAKNHIQDIVHSVESAIASLSEAARRAAQETESVDQAFQERVKRNYDMLSEAVHMMSVISGGQPLNPANAHRPTRSKPPTPSASMPRPMRDTRPPEVSPSRPEKLRLSDVENPDIFRLSDKAPPPATPPATSQSSESGFWRDFLGGIEPQAKPGKPEERVNDDIVPDNLDDLMIYEIGALGIEALTLLSTERVSEAITAMLTEDHEGARILVRRAAPAAIRRLGRRLTSDLTLKDQACDFIAYYDRMINQALMAKDARQALISLLNSDSGRAYLLCDAAINDLI